MKRFIICLMFFCFGSLARGQIYTANLTASGSTCATAGACVSAPVGNAQGGATLQLDGTFSATVQFEGLGGGSTWQPLNVTPSNSTTAVTSATGTGIWQVNVAGFTSIRIRCSTYASGTVVATITLSNQAAILNGGGGGGGGGVSSVSGTAPITSSGGTTPVIGCATCNTSSGGTAFPIVTKTTTYSALSTDVAILCNGTFTTTLPISSIIVGQFYRIKNIGTGVCTVSAGGSVNIDNATTAVISIRYNSIDVQWDGTQYWIF